MTDATDTPISLTRPITTAAGVQVTSVTMRRAKVRDLRRMKDFGSDDLSQELGLMAHLAGLVPEDFDEIDAADFRKIQLRFRDFLGM